jgi:glucose-1-phosphate cytidylyltransferase
MAMDCQRRHGRVATRTAVQPMGRYGAIDLRADGVVRQFHEKPAGDGGWINGGFFVLEPEALDYIRLGDATQWEREPMEQLTADGQLAAYKHHGYWRPMDTLRDKRDLESLWVQGDAPWKVWGTQSSRDQAATELVKAA